MDLLTGEEGEEEVGQGRTSNIDVSVQYKDQFSIFQSAS